MIKSILKSDSLTAQQGLKFLENERRVKNTIRSQTTTEGDGHDTSYRQNSENLSKDCDDAATCIVDLKKVKKQFIIWNKAFQGMPCAILSYIQKSLFSCSSTARRNL